MYICNFKPLPIRPLHNSVCAFDVYESTEPQMSFGASGSRSVAIDLARCTRSDCGITHREKRETARNRDIQIREEQRTDMTHIKSISMGSQSVQKESDRRYNV